MIRRKSIELADRSQQGFLDDIFGVEVLASPYREASVGPTAEPGKLADIAVLSKDITTIPEEEILSSTVTYTIVGGKVIYRK